MSLFSNPEAKERQEVHNQQTRAEQFAMEQMQFQAGSDPGDDQVSMAHMDQRADLMRWQQDLNDELEQLKRDLRCQYVDENGRLKQKEIVEYDYQNRRTIKYPMKPLINDVGIQMIETEVRPLLSRNIMMSNLTEKRILRILRDTSDTIVDNLVENYDIFDCDFINFDHVMRLVKNVIIPAPYRALNNGERVHQRTINKRVEAHTDRPEPKQNKSIFSSLT